MESVRQQMIDTGRWIMEKNLTWGTSGNISAREGGRVYLTASGTVLGDLKEEDIVVLDLSGKVLSGEKSRPRRRRCIWPSTEFVRTCRGSFTHLRFTVPLSPAVTWN